MAFTDKEALDYHSQGRPGKTEVVSTKPCLTQRDLSLAYSPGVAVPCLEIEKNPEDAYKYTNRGNLVAVLSNGTAVLGLGNIGALAGKPVMEGKGVLFKRFAGVDVFDINVDTMDPEEVIRVTQLLEPTFGGINLEDIKAPECFYIEETLKKTMKIPVFHDDQHGTAIISGAALINAAEISGKEIKDLTVVVSGAGASAIACAKFYEVLGVPRKNFLLVDTKGVVYHGRKEGMNPFKEYFAQDTEKRTLSDAMEGADVFLGCSVGGLVTQDMVRSMAPNPIVFAMANPDPEISYEDAKAARGDVIMATGRSDYPNQVNNVLGFPYIFRGALDVRATAINEEMKLAAARSLAALAKEPVPESVSQAYGGQAFSFGPEYIIPKPFDSRVLYWEAPAVAKAACDTGVAQQPITDWEAYRAKLEGMTSKSQQIMRTVNTRAKRSPRRIVFSEGAEPKILMACRTIVSENLARPILLGNRNAIEAAAAALDVDLQGMQIVDPKVSEDTEEFARELYRIRARKGFTPQKARLWMSRYKTQYGMMMLRTGKADGMVAGVDKPYADTFRTVMPLAEIQAGISRVSGLHIMLTGDRVLFFSDTAINVDPSAEQLAGIALMASEMARYFNFEPRVALLAFSSFGDNNHPAVKKVRKAVEILQKSHPNLHVDGEMQGDIALVPELSREHYPHSKIQGDANVLVFPDLHSGHIAFKLVQRCAKCEVIGPLLLGLKYPVNVVSYDSTVRDIVNMAAITAIEAKVYRD